MNLTTGGAPYMTVAGAGDAGRDLQARGRFAQHGLDEFRPLSDAEPLQDFKHDWEPQALENSRDLVFRNTFKDIEYVLRTLGDAGTRFEFECYDTAHLYNLAHFLERGLVKPPLFVQTVFGILGGIGPHPEDVLHMKRTADRLFGKHYKWSVLGAGRNQLPSPRMAAAMGGNVRVGLEDSLWAGPGQARDQQRRAGARRASDHRGPRPRGREPGRGARNPGAQGRRPRRILTPRFETCCASSL